MTDHTHSDLGPIKHLQEVVDRRLGFADLPDEKRLSAFGGDLPDSIRKKAKRILEHFDASNVYRLLAEEKQLAGGDGVVSDASVPTIFQRTVIREALYKTVGLEYVDVNGAPFGPSVTIPYSYRDTTAAGRTSTRVYEGGEIPRAGVIQTSCEAFPTPQKIALGFSDELKYLASGRLINWDVERENADNAARIVAEGTDYLISADMLRSADEHGAVAVTNENLELQADDVKSIFVLANFPVVRPRADFDLQGNQVGSTEFPVVVTYDSVARAEYDGTGTQSAGTYYVLDYDHGEIHLVDESGAVQVPADGTAYTISYSYATNVYAFDTDIPSGKELDEHMDTLLYRFALRKSVLEDDRYYTPDFALMSGNTATLIEQAKKFGANFKRAGSDLQRTGDLGMIKDVPCSKVFGPGNLIGDKRILLGQKNTTRFRMMKPWTLTALVSERGPNGRFTGKKEAYGDQFIAIKTPPPLRAAYTSLVLYSASGRVAR